MTHGLCERDRRLGDALIDFYVEWREECSAVQLAYEQWCRASQNDRAAGFAAYSAALDREERASAAYADLIRRATPPAQQPA
jgi:hypothetical protein